MTDECEYKHEDFCIIEENTNYRCSLAKGDLKICTAKPSDLVEFCEDCDNEVNKCKCGEV